MGDYENIIHAATENAEKRGHEAGRVVGRAEGRAEVAKMMIAAGMDAEKVAEIMQISVEEVAKIIQ